jgi:GTP cyclohydrolase II
MPAAKRKNAGNGKDGSAKKGKSEASSNNVHNFDYTWKNLHDDLEAKKYAGKYCGANGAWHGLAGIRAGKNLDEYHTKRSKDEYYVESIDRHLQKSSTRRRWNDLVCIDPLGMYASRPTMSATTANMTIPEIMDELQIDNTVVNPDRSIHIVKMAVDYAWNIPAMAERIKIPEDQMREALYEYSGQPSIKDKNFKAYMPPLGGCTVYFFGDIDKLSDPKTEVAVRVHDSCCGSDVFGTDICTCRPYLMFAVQACVTCAQRGGVGIVVYFQKEGRSLGEVTKFRVYNARKRQEGGDCAEKYFYQTESIAGIRDARFQELMPDVLLWLGIERIDWLLSMSNEKYEAITDMNIKVMQRVALPDMFVPANAGIEINAKVASGYHADAIDTTDTVRALRNLKMIRERCNKVYDLAKTGDAIHFSLDASKLPAVVDYVLKVTKKNYPDNNIPYHARLRHFDEKALEAAYAKWPCDETEKVRRLVDLITVSVLLDAGAGDTWSYRTHSGKIVARSEGLAAASYDMFFDGIFSSDVAQPARVNSAGLAAMNLKEFTHAFQVNENNPMTGVEGRFTLMKRLGEAMAKNPKYFGAEVHRPGNLVDYVLKNAKNKHVSINVLWEGIIAGLETIWPENLAGVRRGDVWSYSKLREVGVMGSDMIPFHKLSQWLAYSLLEPIERLDLVWDDLDLLTGLAEYRNGGLFVDFGVLTLKDLSVKDATFDVGSELVVEWRALTLCLLDELAREMRKKLKKTEKELPLAKVLQGGTWAAGRAIAAEKRKGGGPPLKLMSSGNVF